MNKTVISAFPGTGKTYIVQNFPQIKAIDCDYKQFRYKKNQKGDIIYNEDFPLNYIQKVKELLENSDLNVIMVSSHQQVRQHLCLNDINFYLIYPDKSLKGQFIKRYKSSNYDKKTIKKISNNWDKWIEQIELEYFTVCSKGKIDKPNIFLKDLFKNV